MYGDPSGDTGRGYDELSAINCLAETLLTLNCQVKLVVKTHPLEDPDTIRNFLGLYKQQILIQVLLRIIH